MELTSGRILTAIKIVLYGSEGIGKSTFASQFPRAVFIDTEGSTSHMDVLRTPKPTSWSLLLGQVDYFLQHTSELGTLVIDTADWAERLCAQHIIDAAKVSSLESFGYGKGYVMLAEEFGKLLNKLQDLVDRGINVVLTAHAYMRKFELPEEQGAYDRWELKLGKKTAPLVKEWCDLLLFANYKTIVVNVDGQGATKGKNKANGGRRVMYATHHTCWDAKNRFGLADELPFDYTEIATIIPPDRATVPVPKIPRREPRSASMTPEEIAAPDVAEQVTPPPATAEPRPITPRELPKALTDLMAQDKVVEAEIRLVCSQRKYFPADMPVADYPAEFVKGNLVGAWPKVLKLILAARENGDDLPF